MNLLKDTEDKINDLLIEISESYQFKDVECIILSIRKQYLNFMSNFRLNNFVIPRFLEPLADVVVEKINASEISAADIMRFMLNNDINNWVHYYHWTFLQPMCKNMTEQISEVVQNLFIHLVMGYILDLLGDRKIEIKHIKEKELLLHKRNQYDLSIVNGVEFKSSYFIFEDRAYMYNIHTNISPLTFGDTMPGFARIITEKVKDGDILLRLDERLALHIDDAVCYSSLKFEKYRGPNFKFKDTLLSNPKTIIIHFDSNSYDKLLMVIKKDYDNLKNEPVWHIEIETLPYVSSNTRSKNLITTFLHGMYYPKSDCFTHIDYTKNQYSLEAYTKKYNEEGIVSADLYTEEGFHYKIWCIENGVYSREVWYELMIVSLPEKYQTLLNEILEISSLES